MTWFKVDDRFHDHRKVRQLGKDRTNAVGLWVLAGTWAAANLTDGFVPEDIACRFDPRGTYAKRLVDVGLWEPAEQDGEPGYVFHEWEHHQPTRADVLERRRVRAEAGRKGGLASGRTRSKTGSHREASASSPDEAKASTSAGAKTNEPGTPSRPVPTRSSSSPTSPSARATIAALTDANDDETTKMLELIEAECHPTAMGPYVRRLGDNGDLPMWLDRVRAAAKPRATSNDMAAHTYTDPDNTGRCSIPGCAKPEPALIHRHLRVANQ